MTRNIKYVDAPKRFLISLGDVCDVIPCLRKIYHSNAEEVVLDMLGVQEISEEGFFVLKAQGEKLSVNKKVLLVSPAGSHFKVQSFFRRKFAGKDKHVKELHVNKSVGKDQAVAKTIDPAVVDTIVNELNQIGIPEYYAPLYDMLIELTSNATEHGIKDRNINWWLLRYWDKASKSMRYVFVDMGEGIVNSHRKAGLPFKYWFKGSKRIVADSFKGVLRSSTRQSHRGKGLPSINTLVKEELISDFLMVTNNVSLAWIDGKFVYSRNDNFIGTFFSWSIDKENYYIWKKLG